MEICRDLWRFVEICRDILSEGNETAFISNEMNEVKVGRA